MRRFDRRALLLGVGAAVGTTRAGLVRAQEADGTPQAEATPRVYRFEFEGRHVTAARNYDAADSRTIGGFKYGMAVDVFAEEEDAARAYEQREDLLEGYLDTLRSNGAEVGELKEISAPDIGDEHSAILVPFTNEDFDFEFVFLFARESKVFQRWFGVGFTAPADEMFTLAKEHMKFEDIDLEEEDEKFIELLPDLSDMPEGFVAAEGDMRVERSDDQATPTS